MRHVEQKYLDFFNSLVVGDEVKYVFPNSGCSTLAEKGEAVVAWVIPPHTDIPKEISEEWIEKGEARGMGKRTRDTRYIFFRSLPDLSPIYVITPYPGALVHKDFHFESLPHDPTNCARIQCPKCK